ncbi:hypothetical protein [Gimesia aquarii]|uniref:Uncharacterized protein n=1 Tax=Gimesia aquarii TaxID=2527964 RepID=A0A517VR79_9PLAN|nr:hypothetical protein [Gimesia aquarii]QDT95507.1 hypothetical protein V144x_09510 [Gimesia aquarii]
MQLTEHHFTDLSNIKYRIFSCDISDERKASALVIRFIGNYGYGSDGNGDGQFMRTITLCALSLWDVEAVVFDLRDLTYEWGNTIWGMYGRSIYPSGIDDLPYATIVSDRCRAGFESCESIVAPMFEDLDLAIENLRPRAQAYLAKLWSDDE